MPVTCISYYAEKLYFYLYNVSDNNICDCQNDGWRLSCFMKNIGSLSTTLKKICIRKHR